MTFHDPYFFLAEVNKASAVMVVEQGIVAQALGVRIAAAVRLVIAAAAKDGAPRSLDYLAFENALVTVGGPEVTQLHSGRSRQDIGATIDRLVMRDCLLAGIGKLNRVRAALLTMAARHRDAIMPAYTWGVQAQPISFGHYLLAYEEALARAAQRLAESYTRLNRSPYGSAALGTSSFPVNRERLAELLGMDGLVVNSFDAVQISPIDCGAELAGAAIAAALTVGAFAADITAQYSHSHPWIVMGEGTLTGISSIMPQKRNPKGLVMLRAQASTVIGLAQTFFLLAHNVQPGMSDYKPFIVDPEHGHAPVTVLRELVDLFENCDAVIGALQFDAQRALAEVNAEYSTTTELADVLQREANVPFRVGHHFASELVNYGRKKKLRPSELPYAAAEEIYADAARSQGVTDAKLPLSEQEFRRALTAENMVASSRGTGGPQPAEVTRMLAHGEGQLAADRRWLEGAQANISKASVALDAAFQKLCG
jgi:argininosuccinate lyase